MLPRFLYLFGLAALAAACAPPAPAKCPDAPAPPPSADDAPPPLPLPSDGDVGLTTPLGKMCAHLRELSCPEGASAAANGERRTCYQTMAQAQHNAPIPVDCVTAAKDPAAVRACGDPKRNVTIRCASP